jgi:hypothetical protein
MISMSVCEVQSLVGERLSDSKSKDDPTRAKADFKQKTCQDQFFAELASGRL